MVDDFIKHNTWVLENRFGAEKKVMQDITHIVCSNDPLSRQVEDVLTVISELCLNAFEHGNRMNPDTIVRVAMHIGECEYKFRVYDEGEGFQYVPHPKSSVIHLDDEQARGWGLCLISSLADKVCTGFDHDLFYMEVHFKRMGGINGVRK